MTSLKLQKPKRKLLTLKHTDGEAHLHDLLARLWWLCLHATCVRTMSHNLTCEINARSQYVDVTNECKLILAGVEERTDRLIRDFDSNQYPGVTDQLNKSAGYALLVVNEAISIPFDKQDEFLEKVRILAAEYGAKQELRD